MPYIQQRNRDELQQGREMSNSGELNYTLTLVVKDYLDVKGLSYNTINDIMGALEGCKLEFYRRIAKPYEDSKISLNGDVYDK